MREPFFVNKIMGLLAQCVLCLLAVSASTREEGGMLLAREDFSTCSCLAGKEFDRNFLRAFFLPDHIFEHSLYRCLLQQHTQRQKLSF